MNGAASVPTGTEPVLVNSFMVLWRGVKLASVIITIITSISKFFFGLGRRPTKKVAAPPEFATKSGRPGYAPGRNGDKVLQD